MGQWSQKGRWPTENLSDSLSESLFKSLSESLFEASKSLCEVSIWPQRACLKLLRGLCSVEPVLRLWLPVWDLREPVWGLREPVWGLREPVWNFWEPVWSHWEPLWSLWKPVSDLRGLHEASRSLSEACESVRACLKLRRGLKEGIEIGDRRWVMPDTENLFCVVL